MQDVSPYLAFKVCFIVNDYLSSLTTANPVPPNSSKDPLVEEHGSTSENACDPKAVFKVNCYNCWCNRIGSMAICKKARKCVNPDAPTFIMFPEST